MLYYIKYMVRRCLFGQVEVGYYVMLTSHLSDPIFTNVLL